MIEPAPLIDSALMIFLFNNDIENGQHPEPFHDLMTSAELDIAFAEVEAHLIVDLDISLGGKVSSLARRNMSATCKLVEIAQAVNLLRQSKRIEF